MRISSSLTVKCRGRDCGCNAHKDVEESQAEDVHTNGTTVPCILKKSSECKTLEFVKNNNSNDSVILRKDTKHKFKEDRAQIGLVNRLTSVEKEKEGTKGDGRDIRLSNGGGGGYIDFQNTGKENREVDLSDGVPETTDNKKLYNRKSSITIIQKKHQVQASQLQQPFSSDNKSQNNLQASSSKKNYSHLDLGKAVIFDNLGQPNSINKNYKSILTNGSCVGSFNPAKRKHINSHLFHPSMVSSNLNLSQKQSLASEGESKKTVTFNDRVMVKVYRNYYND